VVAGEALHAKGRAACGLKVDTHLFARAVQLTKEGTRGEPFDIADESWGADYADPYDFINVLLDGNNIRDSNNNNFAYLNDPSFNKQMTQASLMSGPSRYKTYGNLDVAIMQQAAPLGAALERQRPDASLEAHWLLRLQHRRGAARPACS
jgi:ABC-type oligopeptide transport system substrate-binding subunit